MYLYLSILMILVLNITFGNGEYITDTNALRRRLNPALTNDKVSESGGKLWVPAYFVEIPYVLDYGDRYEYAEEAKVYIDETMAEIIADLNAYTNIRLKPRYDEVKYVSMLIDPESLPSCGSIIGSGDGVQNINLEWYNRDPATEGESCWYKGNVLHELLHSLGLDHTQSRNDRDDYVTINTDNIQTDGQPHFIKTTTLDDCGYYDYDSIMHYGSTDFGILNDEGEPAITIDPKVSGTVLQNSKYKELSREDINCLDYLYRPNTIPVRIIPYNTPKKYVRYTNPDFKLNANDDSIISKSLDYLQSSTFRLIEPGLAGESDDYPNSAVSFELSEYPKNYIIVDFEDFDATGDNFAMKYGEYKDDDIDYKRSATFFIVTALNGDADYVSFQWKSFAGIEDRYIRVTEEGLLYLENVGDKLFPPMDTEWINSASFKLECVFIHKTAYVDTCPIDYYKEHFTLTSPKEIKCNKRVMSALVATGGTKTFTFINDVTQEVLFEYIDEDDSGIVKPRVQLKSAINDQVVVPEAIDDGGQHFTQLADGTYILEVQPETDVAPGGIFSVKVTCAPAA